MSIQTTVVIFIKGTSYPSMEPMLQTKGASFSANGTSRIGPIEREVKLKELGKMIKGFVG